MRASARPGLSRMAALCVGGAAVLACAAAPSFADRLTYRNARYGTTISFPAELFYRRNPPPANGDGMSFAADDGAKLSIWGSLNVESLDEQGWADQAAGGIPNPTLRRVGKGWVVVSGTDGADIVYERFEFGAEDVVHGFELRYPAARKARYDPLIGDIAASLGGP